MKKFGETCPTSPCGYWRPWPAGLAPTVEGELVPDLDAERLLYSCSPVIRAACGVGGRPPAPGDQAIIGSELGLRLPRFCL